MGPRKVPLLHLTTTFLVTVSLRRTIYNSFHNWDAGLQFLSDNLKEISGKLFELRDFAFTSALPVGKDRTKFSSCMKKVLVLADIFQDSTIRFAVTVHPSIGRVCE